ncbi:MAG: c-type cytochrome [Gemmatimonadetes bacterium]|nr:c-type cytochrome [Gemmatimonadota bacterium]
MWKTNLKVLAVGAVVVGFYTAIANVIPQLESELPEELSLGEGVTPEALVAAGEKIFEGAGGCVACHGLGTRAPNLLTDEKGSGLIGERCAQREPGKSCKEYLYESMTSPQTYLVPGYGPIMPDVRKQLPMDQIWALVAFLESQGGEVDVTAEDLGSTAGQSEASAASAGGGTTDPMALIQGNGCLACHKLKGEGADLGPSFDGMGRRLSKDDIRESIIDPDARIAKGYEPFKGMMPKTFGEQLNAKQLESLVNFLASQK